MRFFILSCDPARGRLWPSLDCASLGHRRGRDHPRAASTLRITSGAVAAPIVPLSVHLPVSPILDDTNKVGIANSAIQFIVLALPIE